MTTRPPRVYYRRMVSFVLGLLLLFVGAMTVFYQNHKSLIFLESNAHLDHITALITDHLKTLKQELEQRVSLIHSNVLLQQYMFIVARLEGEPASFQRVYKEQIGHLPHERTLVMTIEGVPVFGGEHTDLISFITRVLPAELPSRPEVTYFYSKDRMEMLARVGIFYKGNPVGQVVVGRPLDKKFLQIMKLRSGGDLFLVLDEQVLQSTIEQFNDLPEFTLDADLVSVNDVPYRVRRIALNTPSGGDFPELWLGVNQQRLFSFLDRFLFASVAIAVVGGIATLALGIYLIHKIIGPIRKLVDLTQSVADGKLPDVREVPIHDEMDYLTSGFHLMVASLKKERQKIEEANKLLLQQSITDHLTGLYNRRYFNEILPKLHSLHKRKGTGMHILLMDIDYFKQVNDTYGHACGDAVLVAFAELLKESTRESDFCFRIGGEEFVLLLGANNLDGAVTFAERIRSSLECESVSFGGAGVTCTVSVGVVGATKSVTPEELLRLADKALYKAKKLGRNQVCVEAPCRVNAE